MRITAAGVIKSIEKQDPIYAKLIVMATAKNVLSHSMGYTTIAASLVSFCSERAALVVALLLPIVLYGIVHFPANHVEKQANGETD